MQRTFCSVIRCLKNMIYKKIMINNFGLDAFVVNNFKHVKLWQLMLPFLVLILFFLFFLFSEETNFVDAYVESQKGLFLSMNSTLAAYPNIQLNITELGDVFVIFPLIIVFLFYAPKLWEVLLTSSLITLILAAVLKKYFYVPRPAHVYDIDSFIIIGKTHLGNKSFPSGHSMTIFVVIILLLFAFMPKKKSYKIVWSLLMLLAGFSIAFSRVAVGAHYPFDVVIGIALGFIAVIIGIRVNNNVRWLVWIKNKKFYPGFMLLLIIWIALIILKIIDHNLPIFYLSLMSLVGTLFLITRAYAKQN